MNTIDTELPSISSADITGMVSGTILLSRH